MSWKFHPKQNQLLRTKFKNQQIKLSQLIIYLGLFYFSAVVIVEYYVPIKAVLYSGNNMVRSLSSVSSNQARIMPAYMQVLLSINNCDRPRENHQRHITLEANLVAQGGSIEESFLYIKIRCVASRTLYLPSWRNVKRGLDSRTHGLTDSLIMLRWDCLPGHVLYAMHYLCPDFSCMHILHANEA